MERPPGGLTAPEANNLTPSQAQSLSSFRFPKSSVAQLRPTICDPVDCSPPGSSVHGILQARTLEWAAMPSSSGPSRPGDGTHVSLSPALAGGFFTTSAAWEALPESTTCRF